MSTQPVVPPSPTLNMQDLLTALAQADAGASGGARASVVPLWMVRPHAPVAPNRAYKSDLGDDVGHGSASSRVPSPRDLVQGVATTALQAAYDENSKLYTKDYAELHWLDMSDDEHKAFAERAQKAGMWDPTDGTGPLILVWSKAVDMASTYNGARPNDKDKWLSPFEALERLYAEGVAGLNGSISGFTGWRTERNKQVTKFSEAEIGRSAKQILQQELGRDPTSDEVKAYTIAANRASALNPQTITTRSRDTAFDATGKPLSTETERTVEGDTFDPNQTITDMTEGTKEHDDYQAAAVYFPALMQALSSPV